MCKKAFRISPAHLASRKRPSCCSKACAYKLQSKDPKERFFSSIRKDPETDCWLWNNIPAENYGYILIGKEGEKKNGQIGAHRYSWIVHNGSIPDGLLVLHRCDTPACVNPRHLFLGTYLDNARDRAAKGRSARQAGEASPRARFTADQVRAILADPRSHRRIAAAYGASKSAISHIKRRATWVAV
jgi:hypothetical protein